VEAGEQPGVELASGLVADEHRTSEGKSVHGGAVALLGRAFTGDSQDKFEPAHFEFPINRRAAAGFKATRKHGRICS